MFNLVVIYFRFQNSLLLSWVNWRYLRIINSLFCRRVVVSKGQFIEFIFVLIFFGVVAKANLCSRRLAYFPDCISRYAGIYVLFLPHFINLRHSFTSYSSRILPIEWIPSAGNCIIFQPCRIPVLTYWFLLFLLFFLFLLLFIVIWVQFVNTAWGEVESLFCKFVVPFPY